MRMWVLGINWKWHDASAALVDGDGRVWAFAEEERYTRVKHAWDTFPAQAALHCLRTAGIHWQDIDVIAVGWAVPHRYRDAEILMSELFGSQERGTRRPEIVFVKHHRAHALSAFYASGFNRAGVLVVDGSGEENSISVYRADRASGVRRVRAWDRRFSLGSMYDAATRALGFGRLDAGKTMGLAPYAAVDATSPLPLGDLIAETLRGSPADIAPELDYEDFTAAWTHFIGKRFGAVTRPLDALHVDPVARAIAGSAQRTVEVALRALHAETVCLTGEEAVCLAGGVALNCVANGQLPEPVFIPPFPHDGGVAIGAAWNVCPPKETAEAISPYLGTVMDEHGALDMLRAAGCTMSDVVIEDVVEALLSGRIGAVAEGGAEAGPRALGHRSIIAVPAPASVRDRINRLKHREPWRPFAPVTVPSYAVSLWPSQGLRARYMVGNAQVSALAREIMPAATHIDGTTRPQVLPPGTDSTVSRILAGLEAAGAPPVLLNTSFNGRGEPIADNAADCAGAFLNLGLDFLVLGAAFVKRTAS